MTTEERERLLDRQRAGKLTEIEYIRMVSEALRDEEYGKQVQIERELRKIYSNG